MSRFQASLFCHFDRLLAWIPAGRRLGVVLLLARQVSREVRSAFATPIPVVLLPGWVFRFSGAGRVTRVGRVTIFTGVVLGGGDAGGGGEEGGDARGNAIPLGASLAAETSGVCRGLVVPVGA